MLRVYSKVNLTQLSDLSVCVGRTQSRLWRQWWMAVVGGESTLAEAKRHFNPNTPKPSGSFVATFKPALRLLHPKQYIFYIHRLWAQDIHTCSKNVYYTAPVVGRKCTVSTTLLPSASLSLHLYISHISVVTGLCEDCIKFWSQCKSDSSGMWPRVRTENAKPVTRASVVSQHVWMMKCKLFCQKAQQSFAAAVSCHVHTIWDTLLVLFF